MTRTTTVNAPRDEHQAADVITDLVNAAARYESHPDHEPSRRDMERARALLLAGFRRLTQEATDAEMATQAVVDAYDRKMLAIMAELRPEKQGEIDPAQEVRALRKRAEAAEARSRQHAVQPEATPSSAPVPTDPRQRKPDASEPAASPPPLAPGRMHEMRAAQVADALALDMETARVVTPHASTATVADIMRLVERYGDACIAVHAGAQPNAERERAAVLDALTLPWEG